MDRQHFVETLARWAPRPAGRFHAYVLLPNHFHLVVETPRPNLVARMESFLGTYTSGCNRGHKLFGHLFCGRYKSLIVDGSVSSHYQERFIWPFYSRRLGDRSSMPG